MDGDRDQGGRWAGAIWGFCLIAGGLVLLADRVFGFPREWWFSGWWTYAVMGVGVVTAVTARDAKRLGEGVGCVLFGVWLWVSVTGWMGLSWARSWPLILIAIGAQELTRGVAAQWLPDPERTKGVRRG